MRYPLRTAASGFLLFFIIFICGCSMSNRGHSAVVAQIPETAGEKMFDYAAELVKISPRDSGTVNAGLAAQWLAKKLAEIGLKPQADTWFEKTAFGEKTFSNIFADYGEGEDGAVILACHYDTKPDICADFQGANDAASACGVLLGLAKHLENTSPELKHKIRFAFFDGEECAGQHYAENDGLHGSRRMAKNYLEKSNGYEEKLKAIVIVDMVGDHDLLLQLPRNVSPNLAKIALEASIENPEAARAVLAKSYILDDHWPFVERGFTAIDLIDFEYGSDKGLNDYWHTENDTIDKLSADSLHKTAVLVLEILKKIEAGELDREK